MFERIVVEEEARDHPRVERIIGRFPQASVISTESIESFGAPGCSSASGSATTLLLGLKRGIKLRPAPRDYGVPGRPHFGLTHQYNCIYACDYCYLDGYFTSRAVVFHVNLEAFGESIAQQTSLAPPDRQPWFHTGEYGDSLALAGVFGDVDYFLNLFDGLPRATLELRTKSVRIDPVVQRPALPNVITSFTLMPQAYSRRYERRTPSIPARIEAARRLVEAGYPVAIHLDPLVYEEDFESAYRELMVQVDQRLSTARIAYITVGALRFSKPAFERVRAVHPRSGLWANEFVRSLDGKVRYFRPLRLWMLRKVKQMWQEQGIDPDRIHTCMELPGDQEG